MRMRNTFAAATAAIALLTITACSHGGTPTTAASSPPSCHAQYETWKHGPALAVAKRFESAMKKVAAAGNAEDIAELGSTLKTAGRSASALATMPPPHCADPAGYYRQMLTRVTAAGDNAKSGGSGLASLMLAEVPLKGVPAIEKKLSSELSRTVGKH
jgi:hypothetical protein